MPTRRDPVVLTLPTDAHAPQRARHFVRDAAGEGVDEDALDRVELLVSEVVTNAVRYGAPPITLAVEHEDHDLVVRVSDGNPAPPVQREAQDWDESGRGIQLVEMLSDGWGVEPSPDGKSVWFRLRA